MQFKKLAALTGSAIVAGMAMVAPVLAASISSVGEAEDMVSVVGNDVDFPLFVVGGKAQTSDVAAAIGVGVKYAAKAKTTSTVTIEGAGESAIGGVQLKTVGTEFIPWTNMRSIKTALTSTDLPAVLPGGTYMLSTGTSGTYKEYLYLGGTSAAAASSQPQIKYDTPVGETSPSLYMEVPNDTLYEYLMTFSTPITMGTTEATDQTALAGSSVSMLGKSFVISEATVSSGAITTVTMLGGGQKVSVEAGDSVTAEFGGKEYEISLTSVASENVGGTTYFTAIGDVNGEAFQIRAGQTRTLSDGTTIGATQVFAPIVSGQAGFASLTIGGSKYVIPASGTVTKDGTAIAGLTSTITSASHRWSSVKLTYAPNTAEYVKVGGKKADVFAGAFDIRLNSFYPAFDDTVNRQTIQYLSSGPNVRLSYQNALGTSEDVYAFYYSGGTWYKGQTSTIDLVTDEYNNITATQGDYFVVGSSGFTHTLQFTTLDSSNTQLTFVDVGTGQAITISYVDSGSAADATLILDGFSYSVEVIDATNKIIKVDLNGDGDIASIAPTAAETGWVSGADYSYYVPKLITNGQGGLYIYHGNNTVTPTTAGTMAAVGMIGMDLRNTTPLTAASVTGDVYVGSTDVGDIVNGTTATIAGVAATGYMDFQITCSAGMACNVALGDSATGAQTSPGFVLAEESQQGSTTHNWIYFPVSYSSTFVKAGISSPASDDTNLQGNWDVVSGSTAYRGMSTYGTYSEYDTTSLSASIKYPDSYSYGNVFVLGPDGSISSSGAAGTVQTDTVLPIVDDIVMLDSEVLAKYGDDYASGMDVVLFGGPCINDMVAKLAADGSFPYACDTWPGENFGIVHVVEDAFEAGKAALVIAGTRAADTDMAGRVVQQGYPGATDDQLEQDSLEITGSASSPAYA